MVIYFETEPSFRNVSEEICNKTLKSRAEETAEQFRVLDDVTEDPGLVPSTMSGNS